MLNAMKKDMADQNYSIQDYSLESIRNRQESRVVKALRELLEETTDFCGCRLCVEDVYAITLNGLPAHYVQAGSIVLRKPPASDDEIRLAVQDALDKVKVRPNHPE